MDRSGLGRGRAWETPEAAAAAPGPDRRPERSPPLPDAALKLAGLRKSARAGREPLGSVSGRRRARTERMAVPRRIRVGGTVGRRGRSPAGDRAEPPISSKGAGLEVGFREGEGRSVGWRTFAARTSFRATEPGAAAGPGPGRDLPPLFPSRCGGCGWGLGFAD